MPAGPCEQDHTKHASEYHNRLYAALDRRFAELRKRLRTFWVFNWTPDSDFAGLM